MSLTELLMQAKSKKAEEFLFIVGSEPKIRVSNKWETLRSSPALPTEWNLLQQSLLSNQQRKELENSGLAVGETAIESLRIGFSFFQNESTMKALLDLNLSGENQDFQVPPSLYESCSRMKGLVLMSGSGDSGNVWPLQKILQKLSEEKPFLGAVFSQKPFPQIKEGKGSFIYHRGDFNDSEERQNFLLGVDLIVFEGYMEDEMILDALSLAEQGVFVIYSMKAPSVTNALRRAISIVAEQYGEHGAPRFAESLSLAAGNYAMPGISGGRVFAHEVLLMKPELKKALEIEDIGTIADVLDQASENSGILTLNQSLLQQLIRRKVDLKTAFEVSRTPEMLDHLLKKVGI